MTPKPTQQPNVIARPNVYVDVILHGKKTIYDIDTAKELHMQLAIALKAIYATQKDNENTQKSESPPHSDLDEEVPNDDEPADERGEERDSE